MSYFFTKLSNAWLHFTNNKFPTLTFIEEILDQLVFLSPHTNLDFSSDNSNFCCISPMNTSDKFTITGDLCRFLQPGLTSSTTFDKKLDFPTIKHKGTYKLLIDMDLVSNNWKDLLRVETFQKSLLKTSC